MSKPKEKSAEAIVAASNELVPTGTTQEVSHGVKGRTLSRSKCGMEACQPCHKRNRETKKK